MALIGSIWHQKSSQFYILLSCIKLAVYLSYVLKSVGRFSVPDKSICDLAHRELNSVSFLSAIRLLLFHHILCVSRACVSVCDISLISSRVVRRQMVG